MTVKIIKCKCRHVFQDAQYGIGNRVANAVLKPQEGWRCTVCSAFNDGKLPTAPGAEQGKGKKDKSKGKKGKGK